MNYKFAETIELGYIGLPGKCLSRFVGDDGKDYWLAKEPASILGYAQVKDFTDICVDYVHVKKQDFQLSEKAKAEINNNGAKVVDTNQLYRGLLRSNQPLAIKLQEHVYDHLEQIRKCGVTGTKDTMELVIGALKQSSEPDKKALGLLVEQCYNEKKELEVKYNEVSDDLEELIERWNEAGFGSSASFQNVAAIIGGSTSAQDLYNVAVSKKWLRKSSGKYDIDQSFPNKSNNGREYFVISKGQCRVTVAGIAILSKAMNEECTECTDCPLFSK